MSAAACDCRAARRLDRLPSFAELLRRYAGAQCGDDRGISRMVSIKDGLY
jgi:hypothetical protein